MQWLINLIKDWIRGYFCDEDFTTTDDSVCVKDSGIDHDATTNWVANKHIDWTDTNANFQTTGDARIGSLRNRGNSALGFFAVPDITCHIRGAHISGYGVLHVQGDANHHGFMRLEGGASKSAGYIFAINGDGKFYWYCPPGGSYVALYSYDWPGYPCYFHNDGDIQFPHAYSHTVGGTNADLYIDNNGYIGLQPCNQASKENVRDLRNSEWLYELTCRIADRTDGSAQDIPCFIAEEVAAIMPCMVVYKQTPIIEQRLEPTTGQMRDEVVGYELTDEPISVKHTSFIVPMVREIQKLRQDINKLKSRVNQLESFHP